MPATSASRGWPSTRTKLLPSASSPPGSTGARVSPQLPMTTEVTPCCGSEVPQGSPKSCPSRGGWGATQPGGGGGGGDQARRDDHPAGVDGPRRAALQAADVHDLSVADPDVRLVTRQ